MKQKFVSNKTFRFKGQVSLEYMLILAAFFSALAIALPSITYAINQFQTANDTLLAKNISEKLEEQISLFDFLGDGSKKTFEFVPTNKIIIQIQSGEIIIASEQKSFTLKLKNSQNNFSEEFNSKFFVTLTKNNSKTEIYFYS